LFSVIFIQHNAFLTAYFPPICLELQKPRSQSPESRAM
jgi:hypothetical protein